MPNPAQLWQLPEIHSVAVNQILGVQFTSLGFKRHSALLKLLKGHSAIFLLKHALNQIGNWRDAACALQRPAPCRFTVALQPCAVTLPVQMHSV